MARLNKFASVNLNDSYGKPDRGGSNNSSNNGSSSSSNKTRISSSGGMLILSRPGRSAQLPSPSPKPGQARLGIPSPVNLPSLKRETSAGESQLAASPPITGWTKGESPPLTGWTKGENHTDAFPQKAGLTRSLDSTAGESLKVMSTGKSDLYAPPAMRAAAIQTGSTPRLLPPTTPPLCQKPSTIIRGEEFPTLQAAVARPPTPPQHLRQKDLHQKQREKQQEVKEHQLKSQQLSQAQGNKSAPVDVQQSDNGNPQSHPPVLSLRPLGKPEAPHQKLSTGVSVSDNFSSSAYSSNVHSDRSLASSSPAGDFGNKGTSSLVDKSLSRSPPSGIPSQGSLSRVDEARAGSVHSLRPQYRSSLPVSQGSPSIDGPCSGLQSNSESSWRSTPLRELAPLSRNTDHFKPAGSPQTSVGEDTGRLPSEMRGTALARESYFSRDSVLYRNGNVSGSVREDTQGGFTREGSDPRDFARSSTLLHDGIPRIEGFQSQHSFGREMPDRDCREGVVRVIREPSSREIITDSYSRGSRESTSREIGNTYERDVREANSRDSQNVYIGDVRDVYHQGPLISKHTYSGDIKGDKSWRGDSSLVDLPYDKGSVSPEDVSPSLNPGSAYDAHGGKRYGSQGMGDQLHVRDARVGFDLRAARVRYTESASPYSSTREMIGSRRVRSPGSINCSFDPVKEIHEVFSERPQKICEDRPARYEDKLIDMKGAVNESISFSINGQRPVSKRDLGQGLGTRTLQVDTSMKLDDERLSREEVKKQITLEDERRKEAAKIKLMELEERISKRSMEGRKDDLDFKGKETVEKASRKQLGFQASPSNALYDTEGVVSIQDVLKIPDVDMGRGEEDCGSRLVRPSSASSESSKALYKSSSEGLTSHEGRDLHVIGEGDLNQGKRVVRSRSPSSWRKEIGSGPTSKLFSSPYIEGGGIRRPSDGGTYKLF